MSEPFPYLDELELALLSTEAFDAHAIAYSEWLYTVGKPTRLYTEVLKRYCQHRWDVTNHCEICVTRRGSFDEPSP